MWEWHLEWRQRPEMMQWPGERRYDWDGGRSREQRWVMWARGSMEDGSVYTIPLPPCIQFCPSTWVPSPFPETTAQDPANLKLGV